MQGLVRHIYRNEPVNIYIIIDSEKKFCLSFNLIHYLLHTHVSILMETFCVCACTPVTGIQTSVRTKRKDRQIC